MELLAALAQGGDDDDDDHFAFHAFQQKRPTMEATFKNLINRSTSQYPRSSNTDDRVDRMLL